MKPLGKNVLVEWDQATDTKILLLSESVDRPNTGTVREVGSQVSEVSEGDRVMFTHSYSANTVPGHEDLIVMHEDSIILTL